MKEGDRVTIKLDRCETDEEAAIVFRLVELRGDRVLIEPVDWPWQIKPQECVGIDDVVERKGA